MFKIIKAGDFLRKLGFRRLGGALGRQVLMRWLHLALWEGSLWPGKELSALLVPWSRKVWGRK